MYKYEVIVWWSEKDQTYIAEVPELPGCVSDGKTYEEALKNIQVIIFEWIETAKNSLKAGDYEWSCFQAQQSAEKVEDAEECLNYAELILEEVKKFIKK